MAKQQKKRGLATLPAERRKEIAALGGHATTKRTKPPFERFRVRV